jgi:transposase
MRKITEVLRLKAAGLSIRDCDSTPSCPWPGSSSVPELHRLAKTMSKLRTEVLAHHSTGASNGPTEAVNLLIKKVLRVAHGFRNLDNYRLRSFSTVA